MFVHINKKRIFHLWYGYISIYYFVSFLFFAYFSPIFFLVPNCPKILYISDNQRNKPLQLICFSGFYNQSTFNL